MYMANAIALNTINMIERNIKIKFRKNTTIIARLLTIFSIMVSFVQPAAVRFTISNVHAKYMIAVIVM
jgi:uncharacterized membrane protein